MSGEMSEGFPNGIRYELEATAERLIQRILDINEVPSDQEGIQNILAQISQMRGPFLRWNITDIPGKGYHCRISANPAGIVIATTIPTSRLPEERVVGNMRRKYRHLADTRYDPHELAVRWETEEIRLAEVEKELQKMGY